MGIPQVCRSSNKYHLEIRNLYSNCFRYRNILFTSDMKIRPTRPRSTRNRTSAVQKIAVYRQAIEKKKNRSSSQRNSRSSFPLGWDPPSKKLSDSQSHKNQTKFHPDVLASAAPTQRNDTSAAGRKRVSPDENVNENQVLYPQFKRNIQLQEEDIHYENTEKNKEDDSLRNKKVLDPSPTLPVRLPSTGMRTPLISPARDPTRENSSPGNVDERRTNNEILTPFPSSSPVLGRIDSCEDRRSHENQTKRRAINGTRTPFLSPVPVSRSTIAPSDDLLLGRNRKSY